MKVGFSGSPSQKVPDARLQVPLQRQDPGADPAGQLPDRPPGALFRTLLQQALHHVPQPRRGWVPRATLALWAPTLALNGTGRVRPGVWDVDLMPGRPGAASVSRIPSEGLIPAPHVVFPAGSGRAAPFPWFISQSQTTGNVLFSSSQLTESLQ